MNYFTNKEPSIYKMFRYVGLAEKHLESVCTRIHYWDFVQSLFEGFQKYNESLTEKQQTALKNLITRQLDELYADEDDLADASIPSTLEPEEKLSHVTQYSADHTAAPSTARTAVSHGFDSLETIQLFDLPFKDGEDVRLTLYGYNRYSVVISSKDSFYKIPKPSNLEAALVVGDIAEIEAIYHRTAKKGFLLNIKLVDVSTEDEDTYAPL